MFSPFLLNAFAWNFALGMTYLLVPLYALELGLSGLAIGGLVGLPILMQAFMNLISGALVDRIGAKSMSVIAPLISALSAAVFALSSGFASLLAAQALFILSRSVFWPANWALASQLPPRPGDSGSAAMGRLNSTTSAGQIAGMVSSGMLVGLLGFRSGFWIMGGVALLAGAFAGSIRWNRPARTGQSATDGGQSWLTEALGNYRNIARVRPMYLGMLCSFIAGIPFTLSSSFYPVLLVEQGFSSGTTGWLLSVRAMGAIFAGLLLARWVRSADQRNLPVACGLAISLTLVLMPVGSSLWMICALLAVIGLASSVLTVYFQMAIANESSDALRGSAMAYGGLGWQMCNLLVPPAMGALRDGTDIATAFYVIGAAMAVATMFIIPLHRWAFAARRGAPGSSG